MRDISELNINEGGKPVSRSAPTADLISKFETHFGVNLPRDYVRLLQLSNGGHPEINAFRLQGGDSDEFLGISRFYHLDNDLDDLEGLWCATKVWRNVISKNVIPIGDDGGSNQIMLSFESEPPAVKLCLHEGGLRLLHIADSFAQFIDMLETNGEML